MSTQPDSTPAATAEAPDKGVGCDALLGSLVREHGFERIPWSAMRRAKCPKCEKKTLSYCNHPHAFGYKDHGKISCRSCRSRFVRKQPNKLDEPRP